MASQRHGGRPRNAWTSSRKRKLIRLYTLTTLDKNEIGNILKADDFHPSSSDIQKRLRQLLPKDYAKKYKQFRPSSEDDMRRRFILFRHCKQGRLARSRGHRIAKPSKKTCTLIGMYDERFKGVNSAFCNYNLPPAPKTIAPLGYTQDESMLVDPNSLLLDGSIVGSQHQNGFNHTGSILNQEYPATADIQQNNHQATKNSCNTESATTGVSQFAILESITAQTPPNQHRSGDHRSASYTEHVNSVVSSTDSRRSSIASLESFSSSWKSGGITIARKYSTWADQPGGFGLLESQQYTHSNSQPLSKDETNIWTELIDDSRFESESKHNALYRSLPTYIQVSLSGRKCCEMPDVGDHDFLCKTCGLTQTHYFAILSLGRVLRKTELVHQVDYFGNTLLHCAVATGKMNLNGIKYLIEKGVPLQAANTYGETFLHLIRSIPLGVAEEYVGLLKLLASMEFPFEHHDNHGRTFLHILFEQPAQDLLGIDTQVLETIFAIVKPDLEAADNRGHTLPRLLLNLGWPGSVSVGEIPRTPTLQYGTLGGISCIKSFEWRNVLTIPEILSITSLRIDMPIFRMDENGDTILSAALKLQYWKMEPDELRLRDLVAELLSLGAPIEARDRHGDTPLAIASMLGYRPVLAVLLDAGANPNTRNYCGTGILSKASLHMLRAAREKDDRLYAMILSCINLLADSGARSEPTQQEEWLSAEARGRCLSSIGTCGEQGATEL